MSTVLLSLTCPVGGGEPGPARKRQKAAEELETAEWAPSERSGTLIDALVFVFG